MVNEGAQLSSASVAVSLINDLRMDRLRAHLSNTSWVAVGEQNFVGVDVGKEFRWACILDRDGHVLLSRKLRNDEISLLLSEVRSFEVSDVVWTVDLLADQSCMRRDLTRRQLDETVVREMRMLITRRTVVADRIRTIS